MTAKRPLTPPASTATPPRAAAARFADARARRRRLRRGRHARRPRRRRAHRRAASRAWPTTTSTAASTRSSSRSRGASRRGSSRRPARLDPVAPRARRVLRGPRAPASTCRSTGRWSHGFGRRVLEAAARSRSARSRTYRDVATRAGNPPARPRRRQRARPQPDADRRPLPPRPAHRRRARRLHRRPRPQADAARRSSAASCTLRASSPSRLRELRAQERVPHAVGHHRALRDEHVRARRHAVADLRAAGADRPLDRLRDVLGTAAELATAAPSRRRPWVASATLLVEAAVRARLGGGVLDRGDRGVAELGPDEPRLDHDDVDAEALHLEAQRVADRLERVLGRVVDAAAGEREVRRPSRRRSRSCPSAARASPAARAASGARARRRWSRTGAARRPCRPSRSRPTGCSRRC